MTTYTSTTLPAGTALIGRRVRITTPWPSLSEEERIEVTGRTGTCSWDTPDSDGDIHVTLDEPIARNGRSTVYAREWEFLDGPLATDLTSSEAVLPPTYHEERLEALLDAIYETARTHGYQHLLAGLMEDAGIPLRTSGRTLRLRGQRVIFLDNPLPVLNALTALQRGERAEDTVVTVARTIAEAEIVVPWPETGEHADCNDLNNAMNSGETDYSGIPDDVLLRAAGAIGISGNGTHIRTWLASQHKISSGYGAYASCVFC